MSEYKNGDTVRVVLEGKVTDLYDGNANLPIFDVKADPSRRRGLFIDTSNDAVKSVEVLVSPLKVGDIVERKQYALLPAGAVVASPFATLWKTTTGEWVELSGRVYQSVHIHGPRTIKYLPS